MAEYRIKLSDELKRSLISEATTYGDSDDNLNDSTKAPDTSSDHHEDAGRPTEQRPSTPSALYEKADETCSSANLGRSPPDPNLFTSSKISQSPGYALPD